MSLSHVLLALLTDRPASGYAVKKRIDTELAPLWTAELSQIYPALGRLQRAGFLSGRVVGPAKGPASYRYRTTASGRRELGRWLAEPAGIPTLRDETLSRLALGRALGGGSPQAFAVYERALAEEAGRLRRRPEAGPLERISREAALARLDGLRRWVRSAEPRPEAAPAQRLLPLARRRRAGRTPRKSK
ncbi:MAG TPA: PadR family transcriptional regulator [Thermoanaerobaculia bacterium]|nr:PadR family transcriptional regulator [Thermoanaerobaculia bacterium]